MTIGLYLGVCLASKRDAESGLSHQSSALNSMDRTGTMYGLYLRMWERVPSTCLAKGPTWSVAVRVPWGVEG